MAKITEQKHLEYATTWFLMAVLFLGIYAVSYGFEIPLLIIALFSLFEAHLWSEEWYKKYVKK